MTSTVLPLAPLRRESETPAGGQPLNSQNPPEDPLIAMPPEIYLSQREVADTQKENQTKNEKQKPCRPNPQSENTN
jgi:hypothetical protein